MRFDPDRRDRQHKPYDSNRGCDLGSSGLQAVAKRPVVVLLSFDQERRPLLRREFMRHQQVDLACENCSWKFSNSWGKPGKVQILPRLVSATDWFWMVAAKKHRDE
jgi:hypothetical protein